MKNIWFPQIGKNRIDPNKCFDFQVFDIPSRIHFMRAAKSLGVKYNPGPLFSPSGSIGQVRDRKISRPARF